MNTILIAGSLLFLAGLIARTLFRVFTRTHQQQIVENIINSDRKADWLEHRLQSIFADYGVLPPDGDNVEDRLLQKASEFVQLVVRETISKAGNRIETLNDDELFTAMLVGFVASDYISHILQNTYSFMDDKRISYESVSMVACAVLGLQANKSPEDTGDLIREAGQELNALHDQPNASRLIQGMGNTIMDFLRTSDAEHLEKLSLFYKGLLSSTTSENMQNQRA